jgi:hypothetical protein
MPKNEVVRISQVDYNYLAERRGESLRPQSAEYFGELCGSILNEGDLRN